MTRRRFTASQERTVHDLYNLMNDIASTSLRINQDVMNNQVEVIFDRAGMRYVFRCSKWPDVTDNLRAIGHSIRYLHKAISEYGVVSQEVEFDDIFQRIFGGFIATPDDTALLLTDGTTSWWDVLGVERDASKTSIANAFRALSKIHHPDVGGSPDDFRKLRRAYDQAMAQLKAR